jgi:hypothetical protein
MMGIHRQNSDSKIIFQSLDNENSFEEENLFENFWLENNLSIWISPKRKINDNSENVRISYHRLRVYYPYSRNAVMYNLNDEFIDEQFFDSFDNETMNSSNYRRIIACPKHEVPYFECDDCDLGFHPNELPTDE